MRLFAIVFSVSHNRCQNTQLDMLRNRGENAKRTEDEKRRHEYFDVVVGDVDFSETNSLFFFVWSRTRTLDSGECTFLSTKTHRMCCFCTPGLSRSSAQRSLRIYQTTTASSVHGTRCSKVEFARDHCDFPPGERPRDRYRGRCHIETICYCRTGTIEVRVNHCFSAWLTMHSNIPST